MTDNDREARQFVFGEVAETYDAHRPDYPASLFDDVIEFAGLAPGARVLEIGAGTGKATRAWVERGLEVTALEPDPRMATVARRRVTNAPGVNIVEATFERWQPEGRRVNLIAAAQSWHWVDPDVGYDKARQLLGRDGHLALFWNYPIDPGSDLADPIDEIYARVVPSMTSRYAGNRGSKTDLNWTERLRSQGFGDLVERTYTFDESYSTEEYLSLLRTHSDHRLLDEDVRERLLGEIAATIESAGGQLDVTYESRLYVARPI